MVPIARWDVEILDPESSYLPVGLREYVSTITAVVRDTNSAIFYSIAPSDVSKSYKWIQISMSIAACIRAIGGATFIWYRVKHTLSNYHWSEVIKCDRAGAFVLITNHIFQRHSFSTLNPKIQMNSTKTNVKCW